MALLRSYASHYSQFSCYKPLVGDNCGRCAKSNRRRLGLLRGLQNSCKFVAELKGPRVFASSFQYLQITASGQDSVTYWDVFNRFRADAFGATPTASAGLFAGLTT